MIKTTLGLKDPKAAALAVVIVNLCQKVKETTKSVHLAVNTPKNCREIRGRNGEVMFALPIEKKAVIKKLFNFPYHTRLSCPVTTTEFVVKGVPVVFEGKEEEKDLLLAKLTEPLSKRYPMPWKIVPDGQDGIMDANGMVFINLPAPPDAGLTTEHLQHLINWKIEVSAKKNAVAV